MAAKTKYSYSLYDRIIEDEILSNVTAIDVANELNLPPAKVVQYATNGYVYNRRYIISRCLFDGSVVDPERETFTVSEEFKKEWDEACLKINPKARDLIGSV